MDKCKDWKSENLANRQSVEFETNKVKKQKRKKTNNLVYQYISRLKN